MNRLKNFFSENSGTIGKTVINHIAMSIFGLMVCFSMASASKLLFWGSGVLAVVMHLFLHYMIMWELGSAHNVRVYSEGEKPDKLLGLKISLVKNGFLALIAIAIIVLSFFKTPEASSVNSVLAVLTSSMLLFFESIYMPVLAVCKFSAIYLILLIPDILCCTFSYIAGLKGMKCIVPDKKKNKSQKR